MKVRFANTVSITQPQESPTKSEVVEPPTESEVAQYGAWLGLGPEDSEFVWIAKQALETPIPSPWIECETEDADVFYYNTKTRESVWDHPYDAYYKAAILKYKSGECSKTELTDLVSQPWLLSATDDRVTHQPPTELDVSPQLRLSISIPADDPKSDFSPPGIKSPSRSLRRRISDRQSSIISDRSNRPSASPGSYSARYVPREPSDELQGKLVAASLENEQLRSNLVEVSASHKIQMDTVVRDMTRDLLKAKEYIELLLVDSESLRKRMGAALGKAAQMNDALSVAQDRIRELEMPAPILARLCGCSRTDAKPIVCEQPRSDLFKDLQVLLDVPPNI